MSQVTEAKPMVWHVGRRGEVAGGMTQVVNGYLGWPFERCRLGFITSRDGTHGARAIGLFFRALWTIWRLPRATPSVVVVHLSQGGSFLREGLLLRLAARRGLATVAHLHGSRFVDFAKAKPGRVAAVLRDAGAVFVLSEATAAAVRQFVGSERVLLVPNAVPAGNPARKEQLLVFGGAVSRRKGVDVLLEAWKCLPAATRQGWQLVIAGPVTDEGVVPQSLPDDVMCLGSVPHSQLMTWLDRAAVAVLPSRDEAMPMFILEAMGRDCCVISTRVGGIPAVLRDGRGLLVDADNVAQLAGAMQDVMTNGAARTAVAARGRQAFDAEYSAAAVYPRVEAAWMGLIGNAQGRRPHSFDAEA